MLLLFESASGYGLFRLNDASKLTEVSDVNKTFESADSDKDRTSTASKYFSLEKFVPIRDTAEALQCATATVESKISKPLKKLLKKVSDGDELMVADSKLGSLIKEKHNIQCVFNPVVHELMRVVRQHLTTLAADSVSADEVHGMALGLAHSLSRYKLKFSPDKVDTMVVQAISLLDDLDKELNNMMMRCREWYGWHFPEMTKIISDNFAYARTVRKMGLRSNAKKADFSEILPDDVADQVREGAELSMGCEISDEDLQTVYHLADRVIELSEYRTKLYEYLKNRMEAIAPNLTLLVGELVGARLISHAGNLVNLAKHPASTIQVLGAEKALFRALKTKSDTPKYGLIYHASLVGQSSAKNKGKMSRMLAAKAALAVRYDALADADEVNQEMSIHNRAKLEARLRVLETGKAEKTPVKKDKKAGSGGFHTKSETMDYDEAVDSTLKRKIEEVAKKEENSDDSVNVKIESSNNNKGEDESEEPPKKKKKKEKKAKKAAAEEEEEAAAEEATTESPKKKKKKSKKADASMDASMDDSLVQGVEDVDIEPEKKDKKKKKKKSKSE